MTHRLFFACGLALLCGVDRVGWTALIDSPVGIAMPQTVINFSQFSGVNTIHTQGPVQLGMNVAFSSTNLNGSLLGSGPYSFNDNGNWDDSLNLAGVDVDQFGNDQYTMTFRFGDGPVSVVGGLVNYAVLPDNGFSDVILSALASDGSILESYDLTQLDPISTRNQVNVGGFRGIRRSSADIAAFTLSNSAVAITDLTFSSAIATPELATIPMAVFGLAVLLLKARLSR